jgi:hypothetical protein
VIARAAPLVDGVHNLEVAAAMGADLVLLNRAEEAMTSDGWAFLTGRRDDAVAVNARGQPSWCNSWVMAQIPRRWRPLAGRKPSACSRRAIARARWPCSASWRTRSTSRG